MSGFEYAGVALMVTAIPAAMTAKVLGVVTWPGAVTLAIAVYMFALGIVFAGEGAWTCVDWHDTVTESSSPDGPRIPYSTRTCASYGIDPAYFGLGVVMLATSMAISVGLVFFARAATRRRTLMAVAAALSVSGLGYAYTPSGLIAGAFSVVFLGLTVVRNWELRPAVSSASPLPRRAG